MLYIVTDWYRPIIYGVFTTREEAAAVEDRIIAKICAQSTDRIPYSELPQFAIVERELDVAIDNPVDRFLFEK